MKKFIYIITALMLICALLAGCGEVVPPKTYSITVRYQDTDGNKIAESAILSGYEKTIYDLTEAAGKTIDKYTRISCDAAAMTGSYIQDMTVTCVYARQYKITVRYLLDDYVTEISESFVISGIEGDSYDVAEEAAKEIEGYYLISAPENTSGSLEEDLIITVVYSVEEETEPDYDRLQFENFLATVEAADQTDPSVMLKIIWDSLGGFLSTADSSFVAWQDDNPVVIDEYNNYYPFYDYERLTDLLLTDKARTEYESLIGTQEEDTEYRFYLNQNGVHYRLVEFTSGFELVLLDQQTISITEDTALYRIEHGTSYSNGKDPGETMYCFEWVLVLKKEDGRWKLDGFGTDTMTETGLRYSPRAFEQSENREEALIDIWTLANLVYNENSLAMLDFDLIVELDGFSYVAFVDYDTLMANVFTENGREQFEQTARVVPDADLNKMYRVYSDDPFNYYVSPQNASVNTVNYNAAGTEAHVVYNCEWISDGGTLRLGTASMTLWFVDGRWLVEDYDFAQNK